MGSLVQIERNIAERETAIVDEFNAATAAAPWIGLREPERINHLQNLIIPLAQAALADEPDHKAFVRILHIAARHGERRREQGLSDEIVFRDLDHFARAINGQLRDVGSSSTATEAFFRLERMLSAASAAAVRGFYRDEFEKRGAWPDVLEEIPNPLSPPDRDSAGGRVAPWADPPDPEEVVGGVLSLVDMYVSDARQWLRGIPPAEVAGNEPGVDSTAHALLDEYHGSIEVLDVVRHELAGPSDGSAGSKEPRFVSIVGKRGEIHFVSNQSARALGIQPIELRNRDFFEMVHPLDRETLRNVFALVPRVFDRPVRVRFRIRHQEGSWCTLLTAIRPLFLGTEACSFVLRGRITRISMGDSMQPGRRGRLFKRFEVGTAP